MEAVSYMKELGERAKAASHTLSAVGSQQKNRLLEEIARQLLKSAPAILEANRTDLDAAISGGVRTAMLDRLRLDEQRLRGIAEGVRQVAALPDPVGLVVGGRTLPNGLRMVQKRVPMGVIGIIYESRPNVTVDAAALCLKAGNACILRGGSEAINSNRALARAMSDALQAVGLPRDGVVMVEDTGRECAAAMMRLNGLIDLLIPRGGAGLISAVVRNSTLPVIETGVGNCHLYFDRSCDEEMAARVLVNAKCSRPGVCNAVETLLVHRDCAERMLPRCRDALESYAVELRGCPRTIELLGECVLPAAEEDYATEFCDFILAVRVVDSLEQAIEHISRFGTGHSEAIITEDYRSAELFCERVDAAAVYVNASTRFTDGGELGMGAEIGISTQKLHARGPMGLEALTTTKYIITGDGQIRE